MSRTLDALSNDTIDFVFDNWVSRSAVTVASDQAVPIVTSQSELLFCTLMSNMVLCINWVSLASLVSFTK